MSIHRTAGGFSRFLTVGTLACIPFIMHAEEVLAYWNIEGFGESSGTRLVLNSDDVAPIHHFTLHHPTPALCNLTLTPSF